MTTVELLLAIIAQFPGEYAAVTQLIASVRASLSSADQATIDKAVEDGFAREQDAVAKADAALSA